MAEVIIPTGYGLAVMKWSMTGKSNTMSSTIGYAGSITPPEDCAQAIYDRLVDGSFGDASLMGNNFTFLGVTVYQNVGGVLEGAAAETPVPGTFTTIATPPTNSSLLYTKRSTLVGRKYRGRGYVPNCFFSELDFDNMGNMGPGIIATWQSMVGVFEDGMTDGSIAQGYILHTDATVPTPISGFTARLKVATQRRRLRS
jgi:hypothetical protein